MKNIKTTIQLLCGVCGNDQFEVEHDRSINVNDVEDFINIVCTDCGHVCTKEQLTEDNQDIIDAAVEDIVNDSMKAFQKELNKMFK